MSEEKELKEEGFCLLNLIVMLCGIDINSKNLNRENRSNVQRREK